MAENVNLTVPVVKPSQTQVHFERLIIDRSAQSIFVQWRGENGEPGSASYPTPAPLSNPTQPTGAQLLTTLNKMNFSGGNPSLVARLFTRLQTDGYIPAGTIVGAPD